MNIVLLEPEIPTNTGNIGRTCVSTGTKLHLIKPLGFDTSDKTLKRAGLDYWKDLDVYYYENFKDFLEKNNYPKIRIPMLSEYRSLNLSNAVAIVLYEALRQNNFNMLLKEGQLHKNKW